VSAELPKLLLLISPFPFPPPALPPGDEDAVALEVLGALMLVNRDHGEVDPDRGPARVGGSGMETSDRERLLSRSVGGNRCDCDNGVGLGCCKFGSGGDILEGLVAGDSRTLTFGVGGSSWVSREPAS